MLSFVAVSHPSLLFGSPVRHLSKTASDTWSQSLSGWPSLTDSEEEKDALSFGFFWCLVPPSRLHQLEWDNWVIVTRRRLNEVEQRWQRPLQRIGRRLVPTFSQMYGQLVLRGKLNENSNGVASRQEPSKNQELWVFSLEFWVLSLEPWVLSLESWVFSLEFWVFSLECWVLSLESWFLSLESWVLSR